MQNIASAERFIKNHIKYSANKCYVGRISPSDINILRAAFLREMSYNPLRFENINLDTNSGRIAAITAKIVKDIKNVLDWFSKLWPDGIQNEIVILDTAKSEYRFFVAMRNCFKKIARQNTADFKRAAYRDEMVAHFAHAGEIRMPGDIRAALRAKAAKTAAARARKRVDASVARVKQDAVLDIRQRILAIETQMRLHVRNDKEYYNELQVEYERLMSEYARLTETVSPNPRPRPRPKRTVKSAPRAAGVKCYGNESPTDDWTDLCSDSVEHEKELLSSLTPEHTVDEIFAEYVQNMVGLKLNKNNQNQH